jgi:adenine-specific DNA glycosylase
MARKLGITANIPQARKKREPQRVEIAAAVLLDRRGRTLLVKPEKTETNGLFSGMWQFPAVEVKKGASGPSAPLATGEWRVTGEKDHTQKARRGTEGTEKIEEGSFASLTSAALSASRMTSTLRGMTSDLNSVTGDIVALPVVKHMVTYREITLRPYLVRVDIVRAAKGVRVVGLDDVTRMAVSSATKKIARTAQDAGSR